MKQLLCHEKTFARIADRLKGAGDAFDPIIVREDGTFARALGGETVEAPQPSIVFGNADIWFGPAMAPFLKATMASSHLEWFQSAAAGVDHPVLQAIVDKADVYTTNHTQSEAMAEWALWQALDWMKRGPDHRANQHAKVYDKLHQTEMMGSRWLVIGFGAIGESVGRRVRALGGHVTGVRRSGGLSASADEVVTPDAVDRVIGQADIVLLALPLTAQTEETANAEFFAQLQPGCLFMNLGRGGLVDEAALIAALNTGTPGYAALDVQRDEPPGDDSLLWHHPAIALTPHDSNKTPGTIHRADQTFLANLERFLSGQPLHHVLEKSP